MRCVVLKQVKLHAIDHAIERAPGRTGLCRHVGPIFSLDRLLRSRSGEPLRTHGQARIH
jgi:hypothetical protein